jgi:hypothetical protein
VDGNRAELSHLEEAVADQMNTKQPQKRRKKGENKSTEKKGSAASGAAGPPVDQSILEGLSTEINLDDLDFELSDDSD